MPWCKSSGHAPLPIDDCRVPIGGARPRQGRVSYVVCVRGPSHPPLDPWLARTLCPWLEPWFERLLVGAWEQPLHRLSVPWFEPLSEPRLHRPSLPQLHQPSQPWSDPLSHPGFHRPLHRLWVQVLGQGFDRASDRAFDRRSAGTFADWSDRWLGRLSRKSRICEALFVGFPRMQEALVERTSATCPNARHTHKSGHVWSPIIQG